MAEERWGTVQVGIPADLTAAADFLNSIIEFLISVANIALATLEVIKAVLIGLLDPIRALIEQVLAEIEAFLNDLRQIGIYLTWDDAEYPFTDLIGGFGAYQTRMLGKLTNRADPTRPAFSERAGVCGVFLYAGVNPTGIYTIIELINLLLRLFGVRRRTRGFATPVGLTATYGGSDIAAFGNLAKILAGGDTPDVAKLRWTLAAPASVAGPLPFIPAPPKFLVEVSVFEDGFGIAYNLPTPNANQGRQTFGVITDSEGVPFRLYGGQTLGLEDSLKSELSGTQLSIPGVGDDGKLKSNNVTVYAFRDSSDTYPIPLSAITDKQDGKHLFQRTFVYDVNTLLGINLLSPGQPFLFRLRAEDMPYNATISAGSNGKVDITPDDSPANEVYVRVRAVGAGYTADADNTLNVPIYYLNEDTFNATGTVTPAYLTFTGGDGFGPVSEPVKVTFPASGTAEYLDTVTVAVILLLLSRSDLPVLVDQSDDIAYIKGVPMDLGLWGVLQAANGEESTPSIAALYTLNATDYGLCPTGLETQARGIIPLFGVSTTGATDDPKTLFGREDTSPQSFKTRILNLGRRLAEYFLERSGPPTSSILEFIETTSQVSGTVTGEDGESDTLDKTPLRLLTWGQVFPEVAKYPLGDVTILDFFKGKTSYYEGTSITGMSTISGVAPNPLSIPDSSASRLRALYAGLHSVEVTRTVDTDTVTYTDGTYTMVAGETTFTTVDVGTNPLANASSLLIRRSPGFLLKARRSTVTNAGGSTGSATFSVAANIGLGTADMSPVVYAGTTPFYKQRWDVAADGKVVFVRNGLVRFPELSSAVERVLSYASSAAVNPKNPTGAWLAIRLFPQGLPPVEEFLQKISDFLQAVLDGLQGILDAILAYIDFIEARILELEALLRRIQALINLALSLNIGVGVSALLVTSTGTDGLVRDFMGAENSPDSSSDDLGIGFTVVAGGIPAFLFDILLSLFPEV
ncbi:MAG: hypothetical protein EBT79_04270 [Actinobacteria bacterium]|nr:hypothetical protein [Actinomycetota bacterium]NBR66492.1 hypothetical protein [Actinomycetota bacterium]